MEETRSRAGGSPSGLTCRRRRASALVLLSTLLATLAASPSVLAAPYTEPLPGGGAQYQQNSTGVLEWSAEELAAAQAAITKQGFHYGATDTTPLLGGPSGPSKTALDRLTANTLPKAPEVRRGSLDLSQQLGFLALVSQVRYIPLTPGQAAFRAAGAFVGLVGGRIKFLELTRIESPPQRDVKLFPVEPGQAMISACGPGSPGDCVSIEAPGKGFSVSSYSPMWGFFPGTWAVAEVGDCGAPPGINDIRPFVGTLLRSRDFNTGEYFCSRPYNVYQRAYAEYKKLDPVVRDSPPPSPATPEPDPHGPDNGSPEEPWFQPSPSLEEQLARIRALLGSDPLSDEVRGAINWVLSQPESGLPPKARPFDPLDPRCNATGSPKRPAFKTDESYANYSTCLSKLGLTPARTTRSLSNADINKYPDGALSVTPAAGTSVPSGSTVTVTTNPAMSGTLKATTDALIRNNKSTHDTVAFRRDHAPLVAQECLRLAARTRALSQVEHHVSDASCGNTERPGDPIFASGNGNPLEATQHDIDALGLNPAKLTGSYVGWLRLNREDKGPSSRWYENHDQTGMAAGVKCKGSFTSNHPTDCDEFPFHSTTQGGSASKIPKPHLRVILQSSNRSQGSLLGGFYTSCGISTISPGGRFLNTPNTRLPTLKLCNAGLDEA